MWCILSEGSSGSHSPDLGWITLISGYYAEGPVKYIALLYGMGGWIITKLAILEKIVDMHIESVFPKVVAEKSTLLEQLLNDEFIKQETKNGNDLLSIIPNPLIGSGAFLDKMTNFWRYEFGVPYELDGSLLWGTDMWVPVKNLSFALNVVINRLNEEQRMIYMGRLNVPEKHLDVLVEMIPGYKVKPEVPIEFEVVGHGCGNKSIDWLIKPEDGRPILIDVKRRVTDFIHNMNSPDETPKEEHDHSLLFRSLENKFKKMDSEEKLQGVWIVKNIKQNSENLESAFEDIEASKIHFAIFGDWQDDVLILCRKESDKSYIGSVFSVTESSRYIVE